MFEQSWLCRFRFVFRVICSLSRPDLEHVCSGRYLNPLSFQHEILLALCGFLFPRISPLIFVRSTLQANASDALSSTCLDGRIDRSRSLHCHCTLQSRARDSIYPRLKTGVKGQGRGGSASLLPDQGLRACCRMWTTRGK
jgi:hypothetical protein